MTTYVYDDAVICEICADELLLAGEGAVPIPNEEHDAVGNSDRCDLCMRFLLSDPGVEE